MKYAWAVVLVAGAGIAAGASQHGGRGAKGHSGPPPEIGAVALPAGTITWNQLGRIASDAQASEYAAIARTDVTIVAGALVADDGASTRLVVQEEVLAPGIYYNLSNNDVWLNVDADMYQLSAGGVVAVGSALREIIPPITPGPPGSVVCTDGYYACCIYAKDGKLGTAKCRQNSKDDSDCDGGGKGALTCTTVISSK